jgi:quinoprotein glucose dehydrogenase
MRRRLLLAPSKLPCTPPPFGSLVAIDLRTGNRKWDVPLGSFMTPFGAEMAANIKPDWGSPNLGGAIVTEGLAIIGAALDARLHGYDIETGREVWHAQLPASAKATPTSYRLASGDQFVAVAIGGGGAWGAGDSVVVFRLRR